MPALTASQIEAIIPAEALLQVPELPYRKIASGKVREIYEVGDYLLLVATDRISAFDVVMPNGVPGKGILLTQIARYWFDRTASWLPNQLPENHDARLVSILGEFAWLAPRCTLVKKLRPLPVEAIVRGYLSGSGWKEYRETGMLFGQDVPAGLVESGKLPHAYFTPTSKATAGHDEPMTLEECEQLLTPSVYKQVLDASMKLYAMGVERAAQAGIIVADTKFEFGLDEAGKLYLIDEALTPDSSRFWPSEEYHPGGAQPSYDKQFVRDYLEGLEWDKTPPGPELPQRVIEGTKARYFEAARQLIGE
ncbi:MAG: phosphoribosylaminoimidazolesuccinocarboxamide synthase [Opitutales bacterium]|nr:phosphoribosylaminoimidazolesuccinocarboxamide synthase [Opitutales bacterium]